MDTTRHQSVPTLDDDNWIDDHDDYDDWINDQNEYDDWINDNENCIDYESWTSLATQ